MTPLLWRTVRGAGLDPVSRRGRHPDGVDELLRTADTVRDPQTIVKWLLTTTRREAWRVSKRARDGPGRTAAVFGVDTRRLMDVPGAARAACPTRWSATTGGSRLWEPRAALPDRCRQLVSVIAFADRPDYAHLAEALGMPVGSIGPTRGRCLAKLRDLLARDPALGRTAVMTDDDFGPGTTPRSSGPRRDRWTPPTTALLSEVAALLDEVDPMPADLVERVQFSLALDEVYAEVARIDPDAGRRAVGAGGERGRRPAPRR